MVSGLIDSNLSFNMERWHGFLIPNSWFSPFSHDWIDFSEFFSSSLFQLFGYSSRVFLSSCTRNGLGLDAAKLRMFSELASFSIETDCVLCKGKQLLFVRKSFVIKSEPSVKWLASSLSCGKNSIMRSYLRSGFWLAFYIYLQWRERECTPA